LQEPLRTRKAQKHLATNQTQKENSIIRGIFLKTQTKNSHKEHPEAEQEFSSGKNVQNHTQGFPRKPLQDILPSAYRSFQQTEKFFVLHKKGRREKVHPKRVQ
jgi:hypothetical protein